MINDILPVRPPGQPPARERLFSLLTLGLCILAVYGVVWSLTEKSLFAPSVYNSYVLQANRWIQGHLDLGQNYSYLEIARFNGRFYVSFPPIPSVLLLPFCALFGDKAPDTLVAVCMGLLGACYALRLCWHAGRRGYSALCWALLVTVGSNFLHVGFSADVWYIAQTCSFTFTMMALYYAWAGSLGTGWLPCFLLALAFGCRPLQIVYLPLVALLLYRKLRENGLRLFAAARRYLWWALPPLFVGAGLMALNFARFHNVFQFGHDYLPEFDAERELGQFSLFYLPENWSRLWSLPESAGGVIRFPVFNGCAFWIFSPIFLAFLFYFIKNLPGAVKNPVLLLVPASILLHFAALCCHATMGGWQFGNRYVVDALPALYLGCMLLLREDRSDPGFLTAPLLLWGVGLNLAGTVALLNGWL